MSRYRPGAFLYSKSAGEAVNRLRRRKIKESPRVRTMDNYWFERLERLCPCSHHRSICCLQFTGDGRRITGLEAFYRWRRRNEE